MLSSEIMYVHSYRGGAPEIQQSAGALPDKDGLGDRMPSKHFTKSDIIKQFSIWNHNDPYGNNHLHIHCSISVECKPARYLRIHEQQRVAWGRLKAAMCLRRRRWAWGRPQRVRGGGIPE